MPKRVLIIGGYGNFGSYIAKSLADDPNIQLIIAGRSIQKAEALCQQLSAHHPAKTRYLDISQNLDEGLTDIKPDIIIHTSGPFQRQGYDVALAAIKVGAHYIDLADGRDFVCGIDALNDEAQNAGLSVISGASSVPGLSSAVVDTYKSQFSILEGLEYGITTAQKTTRGLATTAAILSYTGKPFQTWLGGKSLPIFGWQGIKRRSFWQLGTRLLSYCNIPDLGLFKERYPDLKTIEFRAGLELSFLHLILWGLSWLVRGNLISSLEKWAPFMLKTSFLLDRFGTDTSAFYMTMTGRNTEEQKHSVTFELVAKNGDGPLIPCTPAILLAKRLADGEDIISGAYPCIGLISLEDYLQALKPLAIEWRDTSSP